MTVIYKPIEEIKEYENNPRNNDTAVDFVAESIEKFGFKVPLVIDENGVIITGHTRYKAAKKLGMKEVPCIIADDLTEEQVKAYRLADNKVAEKAEWDFELLVEELNGIEGIEMSEFGFSSLESIDLDGYEPSGNDEEDEADEEEKKKYQKCPHCGEMVEV